MSIDAEFRILGIDRWTVRDTGAVVSLPLIPSLYKHQSRERAQEPPKWTGRPPAAIADALPVMRLNNIPARVRATAPPRATVVMAAPPAPLTPAPQDVPPPLVDDDSMEADSADYARHPWTVRRLSSLTEYSSAKLRAAKLAARIACNVRAEKQMRANTIPAPFSRQLIYWCLCRISGYSMVRVGRVVERDHSTVISGVKKIDACVRSNDIAFDADTDILDLFGMIFAADNSSK